MNPLFKNQTAWEKILSVKILIDKNEWNADQPCAILSSRWWFFPRVPLSLQPRDGRFVNMRTVYEDGGGNYELLYL